MDREFVINGKQVSFKTILKVYEKDKGKLVKFCHFLTQLDIAPNNIKRQKVKPAIDGDAASGSWQRRENRREICSLF